jgi:hypothetical protein
MKPLRTIALAALFLTCTYNYMALALDAFELESTGSCSECSVLQYIHPTNEVSK